MSLDDLLKDFEIESADWNAIARTNGTVIIIEDAVGKFLETVWPKIEPYVDMGLDFVAIAAGSAVGPLAPLVSYVATSFGKVGLNYLVRWLAVKLQANHGP